MPRQTVKTTEGEVIRLLKTITSERYSEYGYAFVLNSDVRTAYKTKSTSIPIHYAEGGYYGGRTTVNGEGNFGLWPGTSIYNIGCKQFTLSTFTKILRNAGAIRQYTRKAKAARA